jgi:hypothetical protein
MFKDRVLLFLEGANLSMREIREELRRLREENELETLMLRRIAENQTSANESANKPKEAAPAPKAITWQEAVRVLRDLCQAHRCCADCPAHKWCDRALPSNMSLIAPNGWEVPGDE